MREPLDLVVYCECGRPLKIAVFSGDWKRTEEPIPPGEFQSAPEIKRPPE